MQGIVDFEEIFNNSFDSELNSCEEEEIDYLDFEVSDMEDLFQLEQLELF